MKLIDVFERFRDQPIGELRNRSLKGPARSAFRLASATTIAYVSIGSPELPI